MQAVDAVGDGVARMRALGPRQKLRRVEPDRQPAGGESRDHDENDALRHAPHDGGSASNPRMRVAVDGRALRPGSARARGVARYLRSVLEQLEPLFPEDEYELVDPGLLRLLAAALTGRPPPRWARVRAATSSGCPARLPSRFSGVPYVLDGPRPLLRAPPARLLGLRPPVAPPRPPGPARPAAPSSSCASRRPPARPRSGPGTSIPPAPERCCRAPGRTRGRVARRTRDFPNGYFLAVGALEPRKLPSALVAGHRRARAERASRRARLRGRRAAARQAGGLRGDPPRPRLRRGARRALLGSARGHVRVARGGLRLHPAGGGRARNARRSWRTCPSSTRRSATRPCACRSATPGALAAALLRLEREPEFPGPARGGRAGGGRASLLGANRPRDARGPRWRRPVVSALRDRHGHP